MKSGSRQMQRTSSGVRPGTNVRANPLPAVLLSRYLISSAVFLLQLLIVIAFLLWEVILPPQTSLLSIPYRMLLQRLIPDANPNATLHPYIASGFLFVSVTTLALVFASGMYAEKIAYANKYVRALSSN